MNVQFRPATRTNVKPLIAFYSPSGAGKTFTSLLLARGMVGESGSIALIDTEAGRGSLYADMIPNGYDAFELPSPFSPDAYIKAIEAAENSNYDIAIIDSMSHEWEGIGGILDMAAANESRMGKKSLAIWAQPKQQHSKLVLKLLQAKIPLIICLRAKFKTRMVKVGGEQKVVKDEVISPIQDEAFIFEMMAHAEIKPDHTINLTKCSHPDLRACFPEKSPITIEHGKLIAEWARGGESNTMDLMDEARNRASQGKDKFTTYWKGLDKKSRAIIKPIMSELQNTTEEFDNPTSDDEPFSSEPQTSAVTLSEDEHAALVNSITNAPDLKALGKITATNAEYIARLEAPLKEPFDKMVEAKREEFMTDKDAPERVNHDKAQEGQDAGDISLDQPASDSPFIDVIKHKLNGAKTLDELNNIYLENEEQILELPKGDGETISKLMAQRRNDLG